VSDDAKLAVAAAIAGSRDPAPGFRTSSTVRIEKFEDSGFRRVGPRDRIATAILSFIKKSMVVA
jgi:hypothetical protein